MAVFGHETSEDNSDDDDDDNDDGSIDKGRDGAQSTKVVGLEFEPSVENPCKTSRHSGSL